MTVSVDLLGHPVEVDCDDPEVERVMHELLADLLAAPTVAAPDDVERIPVHGSLTATLLADLIEHLDDATVRFGAGHLLPHAAAVARTDGSAALLCGEAGAGTSTLAAALLRRGCAYLTDRTAVLDPETLEVLPVRRPISLTGDARSRHATARPPWAGPDDAWLVPAGALAQVALPTGPLEPRLLVFPRYDANAAGTHVVRVAAAEAAYLVGGRSSRLADVTGGALPVLARLARRVPAYRLHYDDAERAAEEVLRLWSTV